MEIMIPLTPEAFAAANLRDRLASDLAAETARYRTLFEAGALFAARRELLGAIARLR
ncbi:MAG: hypothetical protein M9955_13455 [Rhizobiaceae bacterium]|nr:hypothetical protein [Rhizobiaceae bacterium]